MLATSAARLSKIQRASKQLRTFCIFMAAVSVLGTLATLGHPFPPGTRTLAGVEFHGASLTEKIHVLWIIQTALYAAVNLKILYHVIKLLGLFSEGKVFETQNVAQIRQLGLTYMYFIVVWVVVLIGAAPEITAAQDQWVKILPASPVGAFVTGGVILFASWVMNEGRELREDQNLVV